MLHKPRGLFLLLSLYSVLLGGGSHRICFAVVAVATTQVKNIHAQSRTCTSDEPNCNDLADDGNSEERDIDTSKEDVSQHTPKTNPQSKYKTGDIIELYNPDSKDIQIVFPSIVKGRDPNAPNGQGYRVTKTTDGKEVTNLPERYLHEYKPYEVNDEALCNIGTFSNKINENRPIIVGCTVLNYEPAATKGALVLQGKYEVLVHKAKVNGVEKEEYKTELPVWKLQRRLDFQKLETDESESEEVKSEL